MNVGKSLKIYQARAELDNEEMAKELGISLVHLSRLRNKPLANGSTVIKLAGYFGVPVWKFIQEGES